MPNILLNFSIMSEASEALSEISNVTENNSCDLDLCDDSKSVDKILKSMTSESTKTWSEILLFETSCSRLKVPKSFN